MIVVKVKRLCPLWIDVPKRAYPSDAGFDLRCVESFELAPGEVKLVKTGFAWEIPKHHCGVVKSRSGYAIIHFVYAFHGLIDSGFRDELCVQIQNRGKERIPFPANSRIAQLVVLVSPEIDLHIADELSPSDRGLNGIGSTGHQ